MGNVFIEYINENNVVFDNQELKNANYFHYSIRGYNIYIPATDVLVKIGDFGLSVKYSYPVIGDKEVFESGYDQQDGDGPWIPNIFIPSYDSLYFTANYINTLDSFPNKVGKLITNCI